MARLIDADKYPCQTCNVSYCYQNCKKFVEWFNKTVEAVEVVHGEWEVIEDDYFDLVELKCSVCGESWGFEGYEDCIPQNYHYCPNCGAKMDGEAINEA